MAQDPAAADEQFRARMILAAAYFHTRPPEGQATANCARVLFHALFAAGLWDNQLEKNQAAAFHGLYGEYPVVGLWYSTLIALATHEPEPERLLAGAGNLGGGILDEAAGPSFTACWLTPAGHRRAEELLREHPDWEQRLTTPRPTRPPRRPANN